MGRKAMYRIIIQEVFKGKIKRLERETHTEFTESLEVLRDLEEHIKIIGICKYHIRKKGGPKTAAGCGEDYMGRYGKYGKYGKSILPGRK